MRFHISKEKGGDSLTLKERRIAANMRQEDVAKALEVDQSTVSKWEQHGSKPLPKYQRKLAALFECDVSDLTAE